MTIPSVKTPLKNFPPFPKMLRRWGGSESSPSASSYNTDEFFAIAWKQSTSCCCNCNIKYRNQENLLLTDWIVCDSLSDEVTILTDSYIFAVLQQHKRKKLNSDQCLLVTALNKRKNKDERKVTALFCSRLRKTRKLTAPSSGCFYNPL